MKRSLGGFTIIEVLIVLAIAGLILLIVFLAVPTLQRNSRNTQRKHDAGIILAVVNEYINNHNGIFPSSCNTSQQNCFIRGIKTAYYDSTSNKVRFFKFNSPAPANIINIFLGSNSEGITIFNYAKCDGDNKTTNTNATRTSLVALFAVETFSSTITQCIEG